MATTTTTTTNTTDEAESEWREPSELLVPAELSVDLGVRVAAGN